MNVLIIGHFSTSAKFRGSIKILWKKQILQHVENCRSY